MKKRLLVGVICLLMVTLVSIEIQATGLSLTGIGGRATVFGGAFRGIANDWSAAYWNPAGLVQVQRFQFGASVEYIVPSASYAPSQINGLNYGVISTGKVEGEDLTFWVPSGGFVYKADKIAFGLSVFAPFGLGTEWDLFNTGNYNSDYPDLDFDDNLRVVDIHPTIAYQVSDKLSIGVGVSIIHAEIEIQMPNLTPNLGLLQEQTYNQLGINFTPANSYFMTDVLLKGDGWGFGGNIGLLYQATEDLNIGVSARYYNDISLEGSFAATTYLVDDPQIQAQLAGLLQQGFITQGQFDQLIQPFSGAIVPTTNDQNVSAKMPLPMNIGIGFAYSGIENLLLTMDVDFTQWSTWDVVEIDMSDGSKNELVEHWDDVIRIAGGLEYTMDKLQLRAGFYTENAAAVDKTFSPSIPDVGRRNVVIGGIGYDLGDVKLHISGEYFFVGDRTVSTWEPTDTGYENYAGSYTANTITILAGFDFNF